MLAPPGACAENLVPPFPPLKGTPEKLIEALGNTSTNVIVMQPGETRQF